MSKTRDRILVAEDDKPTLKIYERIFPREFSGYNPEYFEDGSSLVNRLEQDVSDVALVFTDNEMPGRSGSDIIREYAKKLDFPFILAYGGDEEIGKRAVNEDGAFGYLMKPFGLDKLADYVSEALNSYKNTPEE